MTTAPPRHVRRNFTLFFLDYALFGIAASMIGGSTVVPDFVSRLTNSDLVIGFSGSVYNFAWLVPQLLFAQVINRRARRQRIMGVSGLLFRLTMFITAAVVASASASNGNGILVAFLTGYIVFAVGDGLVTVIWADLLGSTIPPHWRTILFASAQLVVAVGSLGTRVVVQRVLSSLPFPQNYGLLFAISAGIFMVAGVALASTTEDTGGPAVESGPPMRKYLAYLGSVLRQDREFQRFVVTRLLFDLTTLAIPFYIVFGATVLKLHNDTLVGDTIVLSTVGNAIGALLMGWLSRRSGSRAVIRLACFAALLHPLLALISYSFGQPALYGAFILFGVTNSGTVAGYFDWIITHAPPDRRPIYAGLANTISAASHLAPFIGGLLLNLTSYSVLFGAAAFLAILSLIASVFLSEPRNRNPQITSADELADAELSEIGEPHY